MRFTKELLLEILQEADAVLLEEYTRYNQRMYVKFQCKCGEETEKKFEMLNKYRYPYCEKCSIKLIEERKKVACLEKYGVTNVSYLQEIKDKIKKAHEKFDGGHPKRTKEVQDKWIKTCFDKYGGHPNQNREVQVKAEKNSYKFKTFTFPSGRAVKCQGYEDKALSELCKSIRESDIFVGRAEVPIIPFYIHEKEHKYFPDIYLKSLNKIIEVKSDWTIQLKRAYIEEKAKGVLDAGYEFELWLYNKQGKNCVKMSIEDYMKSK
jgi:hypothetical protein